MTKQEIDDLIKEQLLCRIAFGGKLAPHIAPFQYIFKKNHLYFHFSDYGKKIDLLEEGVPVCVEIEKYAPNLSEYQFVILTGKLQVVTNAKERTDILNMIVNSAKTKNLSANFLHAHGIPKNAGWSALTADKPLIIVKLVKVTKINGLKSP